MLNKVRLFCFPYAGGTSSFFYIVEKELGAIAIIKMECAGHGKRYKDEFYTSIDELADDMICIMRAGLKGKYALFGYSMGSIVLGKR